MRIGYGNVRMALYAAALVTPFTMLRFGFVGLGEILFALALLMMLVLNGGNIRRDPILAPLVSFWSAYLLLISIGFSYNVVILGHASGTYFGAAFDFLSYFVILSVVALLGDKRLYHGSSPQVFCETIFLIWGIAFSVLYLMSLQTPQIFGLPLRYYDHFSPLVENVHQASMITSAMPFIMWFLALRHGSLLRRVFYLLAGGLFVLMALESGSTKAFLAVLVGSFMSVLFLFLQNIPLYGGSRIVKFFVVGLLALGGVAVVAANFDTITLFATLFFQEHDGSSAREILYSNGFEHGMKSFLVGYGPGPHATYTEGFFSDAHNTVLTIFLQGGVVAVLLFLVAVYRLVLTISTSFFLIGSISAISMYLLGGDILRRLPIWLIVVGIIYLSQKAHSKPVIKPVRTHRMVDPLPADYPAQIRQSGS